MKIVVKTLNKEQFHIEVNPTDNIMTVKSQIEDLRGRDLSQAENMLIIHQGKILEDDTTLEENNVTEHSFFVVTPKSKKMIPSSSATETAMSSTTAPSGELRAPASSTPSRRVTRALASPPAPDAAESTIPEAPNSAGTAATTPRALNPAGNSGQTTSNREDPVVQNILDIGGGNWNRETVVRALAASRNNPDDAIEFLYSGASEAAEVASVPPQGVEPARASVPDEDPADRAALDRLSAMGFDRQLANEAFQACDGDEMLAANYLLESAED
jgi:UV excision repair protein RAD23